MILLFTVIAANLLLLIFAMYVWKKMWGGAVVSIYRTGINNVDIEISYGGRVVAIDDESLPINGSIRIETDGAIDRNYNGYTK